jgi:4-hydroxy-tetrahydrodipicolinate reductase
VALLGTGVNPGFAIDKLVLTLATVCQNIKRVKVRRVVDATQRRLPLQKNVGAGMSVEEFRKNVEAGIIKHQGLPESTAMIADSLGLRLERIEEAIDPVVADERVSSQFFEVAKGAVRGLRQVARGIGRGEDEFVRLELEVYLGAPEPADTIEISGVPDLKLIIPGGMHSDLVTAAIAVNCVPALLDVKPGLRTARDIPMCYLPGFVQKAASSSWV